uniref:Uncharacterized protein n=1 Tax=Panagrolaimus sp. ES5 TaxID=591445 RepID=A0AC34FYG2_9BILA
MKFLIFFLTVAVFAVQLTFQASIHKKKHEKFMIFPVKNFEVLEDDILDESEKDDVKINLNNNDNDDNENDNLVLIDKNELKKLVADEKAAFETLKSVLDIPRKRHRRTPKYAQTGYGRVVSDRLDDKFGGQDWYDKAARPITHGVWHTSAGVAKSIGNAGKWTASQVNSDYKPEYYNDRGEYARAGEQFRRTGYGTPEEKN